MLSIEEQIDRICNLIDQQSNRLDILEQSICILLSQHMIEEYSTIENALNTHTTVHIFFNCDEEKSSHSMNILYNNNAYEDSMYGRKNLMDRIMQELEKKTIQIKTDELDIVKRLVLLGIPSEASKYIKYGRIVSIDVH